MAHDYILNAFSLFSTRLQESEALNLFTEVFIYHGALGRRQIINQTRNNSYSEIERLRVTPLVFGLMPLKALSRDSISVPIRGHISNHLERLGIDVNQKLIDVVKEISDQFYQAKSSPKYKRSKYSLSRVIQAHSQIYQDIQQKQDNRCAVCGLYFNSHSEQDKQPTLDHCIPWNLIGDPSDGSNWQILCKQCNNAKHHYLSHFQFPEILNWVYTDRRESLINSKPSMQTRYVVLTQKSYCEYPNCTSNHRNSQLFVVSDKNALPVVDHCKVYCSQHYNIIEEL